MYSAAVTGGEERGRVEENRRGGYDKGYKPDSTMWWGEAAYLSVPKPVIVITVEFSLKAVPANILSKNIPNSTSYNLKRYVGIQK